MLATYDEADVSRHKCLIYDGHASEQLPVVIPLLKEGLARNYRCLYLGAPDSVRMAHKSLLANGVNVDAEMMRGTLILSSDRSHLVGGRFDPRAMVDSLVDAIDAAVAEGYKGLCATGDMRWELGDDERSFDKLLEYEALLEQIFREKPLMGVCQYHRDVLPPHAIRDALMTHRSAYVGDSLTRDNLFYMPPELLLESKSTRNAAKHGEWMYKQITRVVRAEAARDRALDKLRANEALLAAANQDLERRVRERTAELEAANAHLEAFSYSVSHDLRAPVRAVKGFSEILTEDFAPALGAEGMDYVKRMHAGAKKMEALIDGLLLLGGAMKLEMSRTTVDLAALARDVAQDVMTSTGHRNVRLAVHSPLHATGDAPLLRVALMNLIGNAFKFSSRRTEPSVEVGSAGTDNGMITVYVRDNGAGFDSTRAPFLFSAFSRLHTSQEFEGTGVGLATVQRVIQRHGGKIWAESRPDEGATFYFTLPEAVSRS
jgi:signal transduction histidine kinase